MYPIISNCVCLNSFVSIDPLIISNDQLKLKNDPDFKGGEENGKKNIKQKHLQKFKVLSFTTCKKSFKVFPNRKLFRIH